jgi:hypothetical protein
MLRCHRLKLSLAAAAFFALVGPVSVAFADDGPPPTVPDDVAAAAQYRESVPTASGKVSSAGVQSRPRTLTPSVQAAIGARGGRDKKLLTSVGSSSSGKVFRPGPPANAAEPAVTQPGPARAALGTLSMSPAMIALLSVLVAGTLVAVVAARRQG